MHPIGAAVVVLGAFVLAYFGMAIAMGVPEARALVRRMSR
jgi:uncharacterized membrane protein YqiK